MAESATFPLARPWGNHSEFDAEMDKYSQPATIYIYPDWKYKFDDAGERTSQLFIHVKIVSPEFEKIDGGCDVITVNLLANLLANIIGAPTSLPSPDSEVKGVRLPVYDSEGRVTGYYDSGITANSLVGDSILLAIPLAMRPSPEDLELFNGLGNARIPVQFSTMLNLFPEHACFYSTLLKVTPDITARLFNPDNTEDVTDRQDYDSVNLEGLSKLDDTVKGDAIFGRFKLNEIDMRDILYLVARCFQGMGFLKNGNIDCHWGFPKYFTQLDLEVVCTTEEPDNRYYKFCDFDLLILPDYMEADFKDCVKHYPNIANEISPMVASGLQAAPFLEQIEDLIPKMSADWKNLIDVQHAVAYLNSKIRNIISHADNLENLASRGLPIDFLLEIIKPVIDAPEAGTTDEQGHPQDLGTKTLGRMFLWNIFDITNTLPGDDAGGYTCTTNEIQLGIPDLP